MHAYPLVNREHRVQIALSNVSTNRPEANAAATPRPRTEHAAATRSKYPRQRRRTLGSCRLTALAMPPSSSLRRPKTRCSSSAYAATSARRRSSSSSSRNSLRTNLGVCAEVGPRQARRDGTRAPRRDSRRVYPLRRRRGSGDSERQNCVALYNRGTNTRAKAVRDLDPELFSKQ